MVGGGCHLVRLPWAFIMLAGSGYQLYESLDWTIVEVTLGPDSQRPVHRPCELKCCERTPEDKTYVIYLARGRVQREGLRCGTAGSWDSGRDLG